MLWLQHSQKTRTAPINSHMVSRSLLRLSGIISGDVVDVADDMPAVEENDAEYDGHAGQSKARASCWHFALPEEKFYNIVRCKAVLFILICRHYSEMNPQGPRVGISTMGRSCEQSSEWRMTSPFTQVCAWRTRRLNTEEKRDEKKRSDQSLKRIIF